MSGFKSNFLNFLNLQCDTKNPSLKRQPANKPELANTGHFKMAKVKPAAPMSIPSPF
jgi:hypothetical protein